MSGHAVRVFRDPYAKPERRWLVTCALCASSDAVGLFGLMLALPGGKGVKGYAPDWRTAQDYATKHALRHEVSRCPTCLHAPAEVIADVPANQAGAA